MEARAPAPQQLAAEAPSLGMEEALSLSLSAQLAGNGQVKVRGGRLRRRSAGAWGAPACAQKGEGRGEERLVAVSSALGATRRACKRQRLDGGGRGSLSGPGEVVVGGPIGRLARPNASASLARAPSKGAALCTVQRPPSR